ncbi:ATP-binding protein [Geobacter sp.]|uniref:ATP-binding protein n=1 Tax=Geobacter sp. TaxID=46610 RepID=UPI0027B93BF7|nr:ATP-binding protein [Geobacter sp.]
MRRLAVSQALSLTNRSGWSRWWMISSSIPGRNRASRQCSTLPGSSPAAVQWWHPMRNVRAAICKKIVEEAGGTIAVTSEPERGTTFTVELPLAEEPRG